MNVEGRAQGRSDSPLTELGKQQALELHDFFIREGITFDRVYTSPLKRAMDSTVLMTGQEGEVLEGITEMSFGSREGKTHKDNFLYRDNMIRFGGEDWHMAADRMYEALGSIMDIEGNNSVLAVSHGASNRSFYYKVIDMYDNFLFVPNCSVLVFDYEDGNFEFVELIGPHIKEELEELKRFPLPFGDNQ